MKRRNEFYPALCLALAALAIMLAMLACDGTGDVRKRAAHWTPCYDGLTPLVTTDGREWCP